MSSRDRSAAAFAGHTAFATAGDGGSLVVNLTALGIAFALIWASQMMIRALR